MIQVSPFKIIVSEDTYIINGGKVINFYNSINYRNVKRHRDELELPQIDRFLDSSSIFYFGIDVVEVNIYLMASFKAPQYWVPGHVFSPIIDNAWIVRVETDSEGNSIVYGEIENNQGYHIRYDTVESKVFGYACNLAQIGKIELINGSYSITQSLNTDCILTRLLDSSIYAACNSEIEDSVENLLAAFSVVNNSINPYTCRGNIESNIDSSILTTELGSGIVPPLIGYFIEQSK